MKTRATHSRPKAVLEGISKKNEKKKEKKKRRKKSVSAGEKNLSEERTEVPQKTGVRWRERGSEPSGGEESKWVVLKGFEGKVFVGSQGTSTHGFFFFIFFNLFHSQ
jgi:hypothetical protein